MLGADIHLKDNISVIDNNLVEIIPFMNLFSEKN